MAKFKIGDVIIYKDEVNSNHMTPRTIVDISEHQYHLDYGCNFITRLTIYFVDKMFVKINYNTKKLYKPWG